MSHGFRSHSRRLFMIVFTSGCLSLLSGCGGGTRGTGDELRLTVAGAVRDTTGAPIAAATITQLETGDSTATDTSGTFSLAVRVADGSAALLIEKGGFEATAQLEGLSTGASETPIEVSITVDLASGIVTGVEVIDLAPTPGGTPTPAPRPTSAPNDAERERAHQLSGLVVDQNNAPVSGVELSAPGSGKTESRSGGRFNLILRTSAPTLRITVRLGANRGSFVVRGLPTNRDARVAVRIKITLPSNPQAVGEPATNFKVEVGDISIS